VAAITALGRNSKDRFAAKEADIEKLRQHLRKMSNPELLLFGVTTKCQCSSEKRPEQPPRNPILVQLNEARKEWKRRNPSLPLRESF
jgi:hypothetical protein